MRYLLLIFALLFLPDISPAQSIYLSTIDKTSGALTHKNQLPGLSGVQSHPRYIHFNTSHKTYCFLGLDPSANKRLYSIDVQSGLIGAAPLFPGDKAQEEVISELVYNKENDSVYASCRNTKTGQYYLVLIDPESGAYRYLAELDNIGSVVFNSGHFDRTANTYSFAGINQSGKPEYISIGVGNLSVQRVPLPAGTYDNLVYDPELDSVFMLNYNMAAGKVMLQSLNRHTGSVHKISSLTPVKTIDSTDHIVMYHQGEHCFIFCGYNAMQQKRIYTVDALSGVIINDIPYPALKYKQDKLFQLLPDPETGIVYCLYQASDRAQVLADSIRIGPNPFRSVLYVDIGRTVDRITYVLQDISGRKTKLAEMQQARGFQVDRRGLYPGIYQLSVFVENRLLGTWPIAVID